MSYYATWLKMISVLKNDGSLESLYLFLLVYVLIKSKGELLNT